MTHRHILILLFLTFTSSVVLAQSENNSDYAMIRVYQFWKNFDSYVIASYPDGTTTETKLPHGLKVKGKNLQENDIQILKCINEVKEKGYRMISTSGSSSDGLVLNFTITTFIFEKE